MRIRIIFSIFAALALFALNSHYIFIRGIFIRRSPPRRTKAGAYIRRFAFFFIRVICIIRIKLALLFYLTQRKPTPAPEKEDGATA